MKPLDYDTFEVSRALTLREAISTGKLNVRGKRPSLAVVQRWANPRHGCRPSGTSGQTVVLPTVATGKERLTMPEWLDWFVAMRASILVAIAKKLIIPPTAAEIAERGAAAMKRMGRPVPAS